MLIYLLKSKVKTKYIIEVKTNKPTKFILKIFVFCININSTEYKIPKIKEMMIKLTYMEISF